MNPIRVLIVDDSSVVRRLLSELLSREPGLEVVGAAPNGRVALAQIETVRPDVVTLDVEMPELDGLQTLPLLRQVAPGLPVIMLSTRTARGVSATLEALALGADDFVPKPSAQGCPADSLRELQQQMGSKIRALCGVEPAVPAPNSCPTGRAVTAGRPGPTPEVVVVGGSTGGPQALAVLLAGLPVDFPVPMLVAQHLPPVFTRFLAGRLSARCLLPVREATAGVVPVPGEVWLAPGDAHMTVSRSGPSVSVGLDPGPAEHTGRPSADVLFRSAAAAYGPRVLALVLTGMGRDGLRGAEAVVGGGGQVLVQDRATSLVWGMPGGVAAAGLAAAVLPLESLAGEILARTRQRSGRPPAETPRSPGETVVLRR